MLGITIVAPVFLFSAHETETLTAHTVIKTLPFDSVVSSFDEAIVIY